MQQILCAFSTRHPRRISPTIVTSYHAAMDFDSMQLLLSDLVFMTAHDSQYTVSTI